MLNRIETMKELRTWLEQNKVDYIKLWDDFHDAAKEDTQYKKFANQRKWCKWHILNLCRASVFADESFNLLRYLEGLADGKLPDVVIKKIRDSLLMAPHATIQRNGLQSANLDEDYKLEFWLELNRKTEGR